MNKPVCRWIVAATAGLALSATALASTQVPHRSGGASVEEFAELRSLAADHNLKLVLAARGSGAYLADVEVTVRSMPTREVVLEHRTDGPLLLATLQPGRYEVTARFAQVQPGAPDTLTRVIEVPRSGQARQVMYFETGDTVAVDSPAAFRLN